MEKGRNLTGLDGWFGDGRKVPSPGAVLMLLWWSWHEEAMGGKLLVTKPISHFVWSCCGSVKEWYLLLSGRTGRAP